MHDNQSSGDLLAEYASGGASPGLALLVSAHIAQNSQSRAVASEYESLAGAIFAEAPEAEMGETALERVLAGIDETGAAPDPFQLDAGPLPRPVVEAIGKDFDSIPWRFLLPGISEYELPGFGPEKVSLLRAKPGARVPQHTHEGREFTLVMTGALKDGDAVYKAGDLAVSDEDHDHHPEIVGDEVCHCLIVLDGSLRFTGRFSRVLNYLGE